MTLMRPLSQVVMVMSCFLVLSGEARSERVSVAWGVDMGFPVYPSDYPSTCAPMGTITVCDNGPFGYRGE